MTDVTKDDISFLLNLGAAQTEISEFQYDDTLPYLVLHKDYVFHDLERLLPEPLRKRGIVSTTDSNSFIDYLKMHRPTGGGTTYIDIDTEASKCQLEAVLNDHDSEPGWQDHRCTFTPKISVEWKRWIGKDRTQMSQTDFATWLEDNLGDIASVEGMPTAAEMMKMALGFEANAEKRLRSRINLQSGGVRFEFVEDEDKETRSSMEVFERFTLGLPVFDGATDAYPLEARLKYREKSGELTFWYELIRSDKVFKTAVSNELATISAATNFVMIYGKLGK